MNNKGYNMFELKLCNECIQMTNHLNGICQKCNAKEIKALEEFLDFLEDWNAKHPNCFKEVSEERMNKVAKLVGIK